MATEMPSVDQASGTSPTMSNSAGHKNAAAGQFIDVGDPLPVTPTIGRKSTNPFRNRQGANSQETGNTKLSSGNVKKLRAVFDELIISQSSASTSSGTKSRTASDNVSDLLDRHSIQLKNLDSSGFSSALPTLPAPPPMAKLPRSCSPPHEQYGEEADFGNTVKSHKPAKPHSPIEPQSMYKNIKDAFASTSSPIARPDTSEVTMQWPRMWQASDDRHQRRTSGKYRNHVGNATASDAHEDSNYHSNLEGPPSGSMPSTSRTDESRSFRKYDNISLDRDKPKGFDMDSSSLGGNHSLWQNKFLSAPSGTPEASLRDGSTIGNIYKQYATSDLQDGFGDDEMGKSSSQLASNKSSSYTNTENLLDLNTNPKFPNGKEIATDGLENSRSESIANSTVPSLPKIFRNPFGRFSTQRTPNARTDPRESIYSNGRGYQAASEERIPLEREVSQALRRASNFSVFSGTAESLRDSRGEDDHNSRWMGYLKKQRMETDSLFSHSDTGMSGSVPSLSQADSFYDKSAIEANWIQGNQNVRVPIVHQEALPAATPKSSTTGTKQTPELLQTTPEEDNNDWETVGESAWGAELSNKQYMSGAKRTTDSIADTSDSGYDILSEFGSTERIAQHPARIPYYKDYRQRDLKNTKQPVFLPVYKEHKVNGYLADSTRIFPQGSNVYFRPEPLDTPHKNPFVSTPPEVMIPAPLARLKGMMRKNRPLAINHFPASKSTLNESEDTGTTAHQADSKRCPKFSPSKRMTATYEWMKEHSRVNSSSMDKQQHQNHKAADETENLADRPKSWQHVVAFIQNNEIREAREAVTGRESKQFDGPTVDDKTQSDSRATNFEAETLAGQNRDRRPLVNGGPGAFYQGVRQASNSRRTSNRNSVRGYATNTLRPLSLSARDQSEEPEQNIPRNYTGVVGPNDFVYRSALAPIKRQSWRDLYTSSQLLRMDEQVRADAGLGDRSLSDLSDSFFRRHTYAAPCLFPSPGSVEPLSDSWKQMASTVVLVLCNILPPLLILYAIGYLDCLIHWWSNGLYKTFGKKHKKWALILCATWTATFLIGLIAFIIFYFRVLHQPQ